MKNGIIGCTATVVLITSDKIYCANAGDSRTVMSIDGQAKPLSIDHKASDDTEKARIKEAGGLVTFGRVGGKLSVSRAIGDFRFKGRPDLPPEKQIVIAEPDVTISDRTSADEFILLACDGLWEVKTSDETINWVHSNIYNSSFRENKVRLNELDEGVEKLIDSCWSRNRFENGGRG